MSENLLTRLLPALTSHRSGVSFDLFEVLHHGTHERQLSNLFAWLLDGDESHELGNAFAEIFLHEVNVQLGVPLLATNRFSGFDVEQEVNICETGSRKEFADIVMVDRSSGASIVVEHYNTADGHGHDFKGYLGLAERLAGGQASAVVLLCRTGRSANLAKGWENAARVTYTPLIEALWKHANENSGYRERCPDQFMLFKQMQIHFLGGRQVNDEASIEFVKQLCDAGEAEFFSFQPHEAAAEKLAERLKEEALQRVTESRQMLLRVRRSLVEFADGPLREQTTRLKGENVIDGVRARWVGVSKENVLLQRGGLEDDHILLRITFGPSVGYAVTHGRYSTVETPKSGLDYSYLFLADNEHERLRQTSVTLADVLDGMGADDTRLAEEILDFLG